jgi:hypothetical protein
MKVTLEFTLPEEEQEFMYAKQGAGAANVISSFLNELRKLQKYQNLEFVNIDEMRQYIIEKCTDNHVVTD